MQLVKRTLAKLIDSNDFNRYFVGDLEVTLVHNDIVIMFMNMDQRFFLTIQILQIAGMKEERIALLLAHELAHFLLDH